MYKLEIYFKCWLHYIMILQKKNNQFEYDMKLHHIAIVVPKIQDSLGELTKYFKF